MDALHEINRALVKVRAIRALARASVSRQPDTKYTRKPTPLNLEQKVKIVTKAVFDELKMTIGSVEEDLLEEASGEVLHHHDLEDLVEHSIRSYESGREDFLLTSDLFYHVLGDVDIPLHFQNRQVVYVAGDDHVVYDVEVKNRHFQEIQEDGEVWSKYANYVNFYGYVVPAHLEQDHCAQTCHLHTYMSFRRGNHTRFSHEVSRTPLPLIDAEVENIDTYIGANVEGDKLRTEMSLKYTDEIIKNEEPDWLRAWTSRFGLSTHICRFYDCIKCSYTRKLNSMANFFLKDLQDILDDKRGGLKDCPECKEKQCVQIVNVSTKHGMAFDMVQNSSQFGPLLRYLDRFLPRSYSIHGAEERYHLHTLQMIEWYGPLKEDTDSHAFVVRVRGEDLIEVCDSDPLTWPNKVVNEADLRTRNMRIQLAIFVLEGDIPIPDED